MINKNEMAVIFSAFLLSAKNTAGSSETRS